MTLSASKLELAQRCEGHLTLHQIDEPNEYSDAGNKAHEADEAAINTGAVPSAYLERWPGLTWRAEVSYAHDSASDTGRFLGVGIKRAYGAMGPFEIPGTIDAEGRGPGVLVVVDKKSFEAVTPPASNPQVRFLALAAARAEPATKIYSAINHELTGIEVAEIDPDLGLDEIAHEVRQTFVNAATVRDRARRGLPVVFNVGRWCRWCHAFNSGCPEQEKLKALMRQDHETPEFALKTYIDEESAPEVYDLYRRVGILYKRLGQQLKNYSMTRPIPIAPGRAYGPRNKLGNTKLDGDKVWQVALSMHGEEIADKIVTRSATQKRINEVLSKIDAKALLAVVKSIGGAERKPIVEFEEYDCGPKLLKEGDDE